MMPVQPGSTIDSGQAGAVVDETAPDDGWAAFSGTSAAAPQLAGVAALIMQAVPTISPAGVRTALMATARDVVAGTCRAVGDLHGGLPALPGPDSATGAGLMDAFAAVQWASCTGGAA